VKGLRERDLIVGFSSGYMTLILKWHANAGVFMNVFMAVEFFLSMMAPELRAKPSEYFKRQCYISFDPDETTLPLLAPVIGEDRIVWASDYPHLDATYPGVVRELEAQLARLPPAARAQVRGGNAARLYGLSA